MSEQVPAVPGLLPWPRQLRLFGGQWTPEARLDVRVSGEAAALAAAEILDQGWGERVWGSLRVETDLSLPPYTVLAGNETPESLTPPPHAEGYTLRIDGRGAALRGRDSMGLLYAVHSLLQCAPTGAEPRLPALAVTDWPAMPRRIVMYDLAREQHFRMPYMKEFVRRLSRFKINTLMLYLEARFAFRKHTFWPEGSMTHDEAKELDSFARAHGVEIVPQVNCFGHMEHVLLGPYARLRDDPERSYAIDATHPDALAFLGDLFDEMAESFGSPLFHAGFDEVPAPGKNPRSKAVMDRIGYAGLYSLHVRNVRDLLADRGKRMMIWGDMLLKHPEMLPSIPRDIVIFHWNYAEAPLEHLPVAMFVDHGFETIVCPIVGNWHDVYTASSIGNMNSMVDAGQAAGAAGACGCIWELRDRRVPEMHTYSIGYFAERTWRPEAPLPEDFQRRFAGMFFGADDPAVAALYERNVMPSGMPEHCALSHWLTQDKTRPPERRRGGEPAAGLSSAFARDLLEHSRSLHAEVEAWATSVRRNRPTLEWYRRQLEIQMHVALWLTAWLSLEAAASTVGNDPEADRLRVRDLAGEWEAFAETFSGVVDSLREAHAVFGTDRVAIDRVEANLPRVAEWLAAFREMAEGQRPVSNLRTMIESR